MYDGGAVLLEKQGTTTTGTYTYGNGLVRKDGETPLFDGLGSARAQTNGSGTVTATLTTAAFGQTVASTGTTGSAYGFGATSAYRNDGDVGLTHVGARYYDAQVGRFITRDTVLTEKPYAYCEGDPVNAVDPSGHMLVHNGVEFSGVIPVWGSFGIKVSLQLGMVYDTDTGDSRTYVTGGLGGAVGGGMGIGGNSGIGTGTFGGFSGPGNSTGFDWPLRFRLGGGSYDWNSSYDGWSVGYGGVSSLRDLYYMRTETWLF